MDGQKKKKINLSSTNFDRTKGSNINVYNILNITSSVGSLCKKLYIKYQKIWIFS